MISRRHLAALFVVPALAFAIEAACNRVPLLAPSGSSITLTTASSIVPVNGSATIIAQVVESAGTAPQAGTHVTFTTSLGTVQPSDATTDSSGRATAVFSSPSSGTATITAISGGATSGTTGLRILVGAAGVQKVVVNASPATVPALGGSSTITATVFDVNGNQMNSIPVTFTTTAGTLSASLANTDASGVASSTLTTAQTATVTASVGVGNSSTPITSTPTTGTPTTGTPTTGTPTTTTPSASGQASGSVTVNISGQPSIVITPPATVSVGVPASFTIAVTPGAQNGTAIRGVTVDWGDGSAQDLGSISGNAVIAHVYSEAKSYTVKASATDAAGNTVSVLTVVTVIPTSFPTVIINPTAPAPGHPVDVTIQVQVTLPSGVSIQSASIDWGDNGPGGTPGAGDVQSLGGVSGTITLKHTYKAAGSFNITVSVTDSLGRTTQGTSSVTIS